MMAAFALLYGFKLHNDQMWKSGRWVRGGREQKMKEENSLHAVHDEGTGRNDPCACIAHGTYHLCVSVCVCVCVCVYVYVCYT
jgi:hypothetical protein